MHTATIKSKKPSWLLWCFIANIIQEKKKQNWGATRTSQEGPLNVF